MPPAEAPSEESEAVRAPRRGWATLPVIVAMLVVTAFGMRHLRASGQLPWAQLDASMRAAHATSLSSSEHAVAAPVSPSATTVTADTGWSVTHEGKIPISGGVMFLPKTFVPAADGSYDLVLHFHGNVNIVLESLEHAGVNAVLAVVNWGLSSAPYRREYQVPDNFEKLLAQIEKGVKARGVLTPKLRRLALTSWSAGFGAVESILEHRKSPAPGADPLDAIIAIDGVHAAFLDGDPKRLRARTLLAWVQAATAAARGGVMLSMTHSQIVPPTFASARRSQEFVIDQLTDTPLAPPVLRRPEHLALESAKIAVAQGKAKVMVPTMDLRLGNLRVQGFEGITKEHHIAHLTQMAAVVLPDLVKRWRTQRNKPSSSNEQ